LLKTKVTVEDKGAKEFEKFKKRFNELAGSYVAIGVHEGAGSYGDGGPTVVQVALWNEFGTESIPERSFIRSALDDNLEKINKWREKLLGEFVAGKRSHENALDALGFRIAELIKNQITLGVDPAYGTGRPEAKNSPARIAWRQAQKHEDFGHSKTLIATTLLIRSITHKVVLHGGE
jgi:hypothetical protein